MQKNVASQKKIYYAYDATTGLPKTGDAANITPYESIDYGSVTAITDTSMAEMDATNAKGYYICDLTQAETNGNEILFTAKSSTSNIVVLGSPALVVTIPAAFVIAGGAAGGVAIAGSNAATTFAGLTTGAISATTITASGAVAFQSTFAVTTSTSLAALSATTITASGTTSLQAVTTTTIGTGNVTITGTLSTSGTTTLNALTVTNATTLSGAVSLGSTLGVTGTTTLAAVNTGAIGTSGTVTFNAFTVTNALTVSGATTLTGAITATNAGNDIRGVLLSGTQAFNLTGNITGNLSGSVGSVSGAVGSVTGAVGSVTGNVGGNVVGTVGSVVGAVGSVTGAVGSVTGNVGGNVTGSVGSVVAAVALTSAYDFAKGTVAMTEAYAANGVAPTPIQALFGLYQQPSMFAITTTNYTVKKLDNSTTAYVITLNDATNPTGAART